MTEDLLHYFTPKHKTDYFHKPNSTAKDTRVLGGVAVFRSFGKYLSDHKSEISVPKLFDKGKLCVLILVKF